MNCDIIRDLLPLYIDECCTEESAKLVAEHMENCADCRRAYEQMRDSCVSHTEVPPKMKLHRISDWKASVMQSVLLFLAFLLITVGVALEAGMPSGLLNGYWAVSLVVPATGFMLSLANWYFVRLYKSRKSFSNGSFLATLGITVCGYIWVAFHYEMNVCGLFVGCTFTEFLDVMRGVLFLHGNGILLTAVFCILSKVLSNKYALLLGRE